MHSKAVDHQRPARRSGPSSSTRPGRSVRPRRRVDGGHRRTHFKATAQVGRRAHQRPVRRGHGVRQVAPRRRGDQGARPGAGLGGLDADAAMHLSHNGMGAPMDWKADVNISRHAGKRRRAAHRGHGQQDDLRPDLRLHEDQARRPARRSPGVRQRRRPSTMRALRSDRGGRSQAQEHARWRRNGRNGPREGSGYTRMPSARPSDAHTRRRRPAAVGRASVEARTSTSMRRVWEAGVGAIGRTTGRRRRPRTDGRDFATTRTRSRRMGHRLRRHGPGGDRGMIQSRANDPSGRDRRPPRIGVFTGAVATSRLATGADGPCWPATVYHVPRWSTSSGRRPEPEPAMDLARSRGSVRPSPTDDRAEAVLAGSPDRWRTARDPGPTQARPCGSTGRWDHHPAALPRPGAARGPISRRRRSLRNRGGHGGRAVHPLRTTHRRCARLASRTDGTSVRPATPRDRAGRAIDGRLFAATRGAPAARWPQVSTCGAGGDPARDGRSLGRVLAAGRHVSGLAGQATGRRIASRTGRLELGGGQTEAAAAA